MYHRSIHLHVLLCLGSIIGFGAINRKLQVRLAGGKPFDLLGLFIAFDMLLSFRNVNFLSISMQNSLLCFVLFYTTMEMNRRILIILIAMLIFYNTIPVIQRFVYYTVPITKKLVPIILQIIFSLGTVHSSCVFHIDVDIWNRVRVRF